MCGGEKKKFYWLGKGGFLSPTKNWKGKRSHWTAKAMQALGAVPGKIDQSANHPHGATSDDFSALWLAFVVVVFSPTFFLYPSRGSAAAREHITYYAHLLEYSNFRQHTNQKQREKCASSRNSKGGRFASRGLLWGVSLLTACPLIQTVF